MDVDWQATGSRSELWDRRQVFNRNRMGAQALSRAREELRPRGHSCLCRKQVERFGKICVAVVDTTAGEHRRGPLPICAVERQFQSL